MHDAMPLNNSMGCRRKQCMGAGGAQAPSWVGHGVGGVGYGFMYCVQSSLDDWPTPSSRYISIAGPRPTMAVDQSRPKAGHRP